MAAIRYRALVVDDESSILRLLVRELSRRHFECQTAFDGKQAAQMAAHARYDVVITDLKMPVMNGHALALELLQQVDRPVIVVQTGVIEPKLASDLLQRGVDDILFKPVEPSFLADKVKALVDRRNVNVESARTASSASAPQGTGPVEPLSLPHLTHKVADLCTVLPISSTALDVYEMTRKGDWDISQIAAAIQRDASMAAEVLRHANCALFNPSDNKIVNLEDAVFRIGQRRVGELALNASTLCAATPEHLPWLDLDIVWKRSMAAGVIMESMIEEGRHEEIEAGLLLNAIMHPLGRVALGMLFPKHYETMVAACSRSGESLAEQERRMFPITQSQLLAHLFGAWGLPPDVITPLKFSGEGFEVLARLSEPDRTRAELVKVATLLGQLALTRWHSWDVVEMPDSSVLKRLGITDVRRTLRQARASVAKLASFHPGRSGNDERGKSGVKPRKIGYCNVCRNEPDLLAEFLPSIGLEARESNAAAIEEVEETSIVNGLGRGRTPRIGKAGRRQLLMVFDHRRGRQGLRYAHGIGLPESFQRVSVAFEEFIGGRAMKKSTQSPE